MTVSVFDYEGELSACALGDRSAFDALYMHEAPRMLALAQAMVGSEAAQDLIHETFVLVWRNAAGYSPAIGTARAWMYSILRYRALVRLRAIPAPRSARPLPAMAEGGGRTQLSQAVAHLAPELRENLQLAYLQGLDYDSLARHRGVSAAQVRAGIRQALTQLEQAIRA